MKVNSWFFVRCVCAHLTFSLTCGGRGLCVTVCNTLLNGTLDFNVSISVCLSTWSFIIRVVKHLLIVKLFSSSAPSVQPEKVHIWECSKGVCCAAHGVCSTLNTCTRISMVSACANALSCQVVDVVAYGDVLGPVFLPKCKCSQYTNLSRNTSCDVLWRLVTYFIRARHAQEDVFVHLSGAMEVGNRSIRQEWTMANEVG